MLLLEIVAHLCCSLTVGRRRKAYDEANKERVQQMQREREEMEAAREAEEDRQYKELMEVPITEGGLMYVRVCVRLGWCDMLAWDVSSTVTCLCVWCCRQVHRKATATRNPGSRHLRSGGLRARAHHSGYPGRA